MSNSRDARNPIPYYRLTYMFRFLLASLNIEAILQESTIYRRRERLSKITDGLRLEDIYGTTIERIMAQRGDKPRLGMGTLMWITYAERLLEVNELCHALGIELGSEDFNPDNIPSISTLVSCCQGLITVDKGASNARLIHFTLTEYFSAHPNIFSRPHSAMAEICLTYLNSQQVKTLLADRSAQLYPNLRALFHGKPLLGYCSLYWGVHVKREISDNSRSLALQLLQEYDGHISAQLLLSKEVSLRVGNSDSWSPFSGLHCASFLGIVEMVVVLIDTGCCDPNGEDFRGFTPLALAVREGHEEVVRILLGWKEVNPNKPDNAGREPLSYAAARGHEGVVKILLGREEVDPNKPENYGRTPLSHAATRGHERVVKILLGRQEVDSDKPDNGGRAPLSYPAAGGREGW